MGKRLTKKDDILIKELYINQKKSTTEISKILGTTHRTILNHLIKMGVDRRGLSESHFASNNKEIPKEFYNYNIMYDLYITQHLTKEKLGEYFNCAPHVIDRVLRKLSIPIRDDSKAKIGVQRGNKHHNWKGGISSLESRCREFFQKNISPEIRERDNYTCQLCGGHSNLHVHHIIPFSTIVKTICKEHSNLDPVKDIEQLYEIIVNDNRFLDKNNLITYCKKCHLFIIHNYKKTIRNEASK